MKKRNTPKIIIVGMLSITIVGCIAAGLVGCNRQIFDTTYTFNKAIISLPDGEVINGSVESWKDFEDSDQIQVKIDGKTYLVHSEDVVFIHE